MSFQTFVESLDLDDAGNLPAHIQEEFLLPNGTIDRKYLEKLQGVKMSETKFRTLLANSLGSVIFQKTDNSNEVTKELFLSVYKFAKVPNTRQWIGIFYRKTGKLLTREKLYEFL